VGIIHLVPQGWDAVWQVKHRVITRLSRRFPSVWVDPPRHWRKELRGFRRARIWQPDPERWPGLHVYRHGLLQSEVLGSEGLRRTAARLRMRTCRAELERRGCRRIVLMIWFPTFHHVPDVVEHDLCCYYIDDEYTFDLEGDQEMPPEERKLLIRSDVVFIHSPRLLRKKGELNPNTVHAPNGVDYAGFAESRAEPADLAGIPRPRFGYIGYLKKQLDWELLGTLAERHPEWSFVFVGPEAGQAGLQEEIAAVRRHPNAHFLGLRPKEELAAYAQHFDACMMPYRVLPYTNSIYPLKMHEYLATGTPVVSAPIESVLAFDGVLELATGAEEWSEALRRSLGAEATEPEARERRQAVARGHDWDELVDRVAERLEEALAEVPAGR
jgi:glycosyltransferase involved in cell wall biosynthesis